MVSTINGISDSNINSALKGSWGKEFGDDYKISYIQSIVIGQGNLESIKKNCKKDVYEWIMIGSGVYIAFIKGV